MITIATAVGFGIGALIVVGIVYAVEAIETRWARRNRSRRNRVSLSATQARVSGERSVKETAAWASGLRTRD